MAPQTKIVYKKVPTEYPVVGEHLVLEKEEFDAEKVKLEDGDFIVKTLYLSMDPYMRGRMRDPSIKSYIPAFPYDSPPVGGGISQVIRSSNPSFKVGDILSGNIFWQEYILVKKNTAGGLQNVTEKIKAVNLPITYFLGALGITGMTAYVGFKLFGEIKPGKTIFVSGAAGATGLMVCQIARILGLRVVGSAGDDKKIKWLTDVAKIHGAFNYKKISVAEGLKKHAPEGIDYFFDNVGGETFEAALNHANDFAKIVCCGAISGYNSSQKYGVKNLFQFVTKRIELHGFVVSDSMSTHYNDFVRDVGGWLRSGEIVSVETVAEGIDKTADAFVGMMKGQNIGKQVVHVADPQ